VVLADASGGERFLTVSGGISENPIDGVSAKELIDRAYSLLREAKASGKNMIKG
jgi:PleD family two-component response regulator